MTPAVQSYTRDIRRIARLLRKIIANAQSTFGSASLRLSFRALPRGTDPAALVYAVARERAGMSAAGWTTR